MRHRLALVAVLTTMAWVAALTVLFNVLLSAQLENESKSLLRTRAQAALSTVAISSTGELTVHEPSNDAALDNGIWVYQGPRALDRAPGRPAVQHAADALATAHHQRFATVGDGSAVRLFVQPVRRGSAQVGAVVTATNIEPYRRTSRLALFGSVLLALLLVLGAYVVTRRVVARTLQPVTEMTDQAAQWSAHDVGHRFGDSPRPAELRDLATHLDALLDRIGAVLRHEKQLGAELAHELRTPLAVITAETDLLQSGPRSEEERTRAYEVIAETSSRMYQLLDTLLAQAAQDVTDAPGRCEVEPVVRAACAASGIDARSPAIEASIDMPRGLEVGASAEVVTRILVPLLGNASRYATARVTVAAARTHAGVRLVVSDDGPGIPAGFRTRVFDPGARADPGDGHPGAGLGLALARRLARSIDGDLQLEDRADGAAFVVLLPA